VNKFDAGVFFVRGGPFFGVCSERATVGGTVGAEKSERAAIAVSLLCLSQNCCLCKLSLCK